MPKKPFMVAEIKTMSPHGFKSPYDRNLLQTLAIENGDIVSVHTDARWGSTYYDLRDAAKYTKMREKGQKVLAKGIHPNDDCIKLALQEGADYVLVVGRIPSSEYLPKCWLEPTTVEQLDVMIQTGCDSIVINSRNLRTGKISDVWAGMGNRIVARHLATDSDKSSAEQVLEFFKELKGGRKINLVQASNIQTRNDVESWCDGFIVGEHLPQFTIADMVDKLEEDFERVHSKAPDKAS